MSFSLPTFYGDISTTYLSLEEIQAIESKDFTAEIYSRDVKVDVEDVLLLIGIEKPCK